MRKSLAKKITLSILTGAILFGSNIAWAEVDVDVKDNNSSNAWTAIVVNSNGSDSKKAQANGINAIAIGYDAKVGTGTESADKAIAVGNSTKALGKNATAVGNVALANADNATAVGCFALAEGESATALGDNASASGYSAIAIGRIAAASGASSIAIGGNAEATGDHGSAFGLDAKATKQGATVIGSKASATGEQSSAFGYDADAKGSHSVALGTDAIAEGFSSVALGYGSFANEENVVSVGDGGAVDSNGDSYGPDTRSIINVTDILTAVNGARETAASGTGGTYTQAKKLSDLDDDEKAKYGSYTVNLNTLNTALGEVDDKTGDLQYTSENYVTKGDNLTVAVGTLDTQAKAEELARIQADAIEKEAREQADIAEATARIQADAMEKYERELADKFLNGKIDAEQAARIASDNMLSNRLDKLGSRVDKVGAGAAALAALHPLEYDPDDKLTFSAGMGNYAGENAAAIGAFYRPDEKFMVSLGGTMGNGENMVNLGISVGLDRPNGFAKMSKRELIQEVNAVKAENEVMKDKLENADERIAKLEALVAQLIKK